MTLEAGMPTGAVSSRAGEFARGWPVILGSLIGIAIGIVLPGLAIGVFMPALEAEMGWTRTQISLGPTIFFVTIAILSPAQGWVVDRVPPQVVAAVSLAGLAVGLYWASFINSNILYYHAGFVLLGVVAGGSATIVYAKTVRARFHKHLGVALALTMLGTGVSQAIVPMALAPYSAQFGWRAGAVALACLVAAGVPVVFLLLATGSRGASPRQDMRSPVAPLGDALGSRKFWILAVCFALIPLSATGLQLHLLSYLNHAGVEAARAGVIASASGGALIAARLLTGFLLDRLFAPYVAAAMMAVAAVGIGAMEVLGPAAAILGAVAIGISIGAELDLVGDLTKRYFGLARFGRIYGILYGVVLVAMAASQIGYGLLADATGSYEIAVWGAAAMLMLSAFLFLALPSYPDRVEE